MAEKWYMRTYTDLGLLVARFVPSFYLLWFHGLDKITKFSEMSPHFPDPFGIGTTASLVLTVFAEVVCAAAVGVGLLSRLACIPIMIQFAVIYFMIKGDKPAGMKEDDVFFFVFAFLILLAGPGKYAIDSWLFGRKKSSFSST